MCWRQNIINMKYAKTSTSVAASCRPDPGSTYLAIGQDLFSIAEYLREQYNVSLHQFAAAAKKNKRSVVSPESRNRRSLERRQCRLCCASNNACSLSHYALRPFNLRVIPLHFFPSASLVLVQKVARRRQLVFPQHSNHPLHPQPTWCTRTFRN